MISYMHNVSVLLAGLCHENFITKTMGVSKRVVTSFPHIPEHLFVWLSLTYSEMSCFVFLFVVV
jgi:hypothetical protein